MSATADVEFPYRRVLLNLALPAMPHGSVWLACVFCSCIWDATRSGLEVHVQGAAFLALDGPVHRVHAPEDAPAGHGVAPEGVGAGVLRAGAVRALRAAADAEEVAHGQLHEHAEAVGARQRVLGQHGAPLVVGRELRQERLRVQRVVLHVQPGLGAALELAAAYVVLEGRVRLSGSGQSEHERVVPFGRGERDEERGAVADPVGVRLAPHGLAHLARARDVEAAGLAVVQHLRTLAWLRSWVGGLLACFFLGGFYIVLLLIVVV